jgi:putative transposase
VKNPKRCKKLILPRMPKAAPEKMSAHWFMDIVKLTNGRRYRMLNIMDNFSRKYALKVADFSLSDQRLSTN